MRAGQLHNLGPHGFHCTRFWEWGDPANPRVVVCVHGLTRTGRDFDTLAQALAPHFRVLCPDVQERDGHKQGIISRCAKVPKRQVPAFHVAIY